MKLLSVFFFLISTLAFSVDKISLSGSSTVAPVMSDIAKAYEAKHPEVRIDVQTGGSSRGIQDVRKNLTNIGMVSRKLKESENDLHSFLIAKDGIAMIIHSSNKVKELSSQQIKDIYLGKIKNWQEVGGENKPIVVVNKAEGRSTLELFTNFFKLKNSEIKASVIIGDNEQGIKTVGNNTYAIGYVSIGAAEYNRSAGVPIKLLPMEGVEASIANVKSNKYPLSRELNIITKEVPTQSYKDFINFALSTMSTSIIEEHYFVPINSK